MLISLVYLIHHKYLYFILTIFLISFLGNKASIIVLAFGSLTILLIDRRVHLVGKFLLSLLIISLVTYALYKFSSSLSILYNEGRILEAHTISHRLQFLYRLGELSMKNLIFPSLEKETWNAAFDSQLILLTMRYGLIVTVIFYLLIFYYAGNTLMSKIFITTLSILCSLTIVSHYHALHLVSYAFLTIVLSNSLHNRYQH